MLIKNLMKSNYPNLSKYYINMKFDWIELNDYINIDI